MMKFDHNKLPYIEFNLTPLYNDLMPLSRLSFLRPGEYIAFIPAGRKSYHVLFVSTAPRVCKIGLLDFKKHQHPNCAKHLTRDIFAFLIVDTMYLFNLENGEITTKIIGYGNIVFLEDRIVLAAKSVRALYFNFDLSDAAPIEEFPLIIDEIQEISGKVTCVSFDSYVALVVIYDSGKIISSEFVVGKNYGFVKTINTAKYVYKRRSLYDAENRAVIRDIGKYCVVLDHPEIIVVPASSRDRVRFLLNCGAPSDITKS